MSKLYDIVDYNNLNSVCSAKSVSFYGYMDSKELFNKIKNNQISFSEVKNEQKDFLKKVNKVKIGKKLMKKKITIIDNLKKFYSSGEEVNNFLETILKYYLMLIMMQNKMKPREQDLKYQRLNKCFKDYQ